MNLFKTVKLYTSIGIHTTTANITDNTTTPSPTSSTTTSVSSLWLQPYREQHT